MILSFKDTLDQDWPASLQNAQVPFPKLDTVTKLKKELEALEEKISRLETVEKDFKAKHNYQSLDSVELLIACEHEFSRKAVKKQVLESLYDLLTARDKRAIALDSLYSELGVRLPRIDDHTPNKIIPVSETEFPDTLLIVGHLFRMLHLKLPMYGQ